MILYGSGIAVEMLWFCAVPTTSMMCVQTILIAVKSVDCDFSPCDFKGWGHENGCILVLYVHCCSSGLPYIFQSISARLSLLLFLSVSSSPVYLLFVHVQSTVYQRKLVVATVNQCY